MPLHLDRYSSLAQKAFPFGLLVRSKNNHYLLAGLSNIDFADISERFFKNPHAIKDRNELLHGLQEMLQGFYYACSTKKFPTELAELPLPKQLTTDFLAREQQRIAVERTLDPSYDWIEKEGISCAWLDPYDFFGHEDTEQQLKKAVTTLFPNGSPEEIKEQVERLALKRGVDMVFDGGFNLLWFEFVPEWYLSPHGLRKKDRAEYLDRLKRLASALREKYTEENRPLPKIFIGLNLTSNFKSYPVHHPAKNIYGHTYTKIPSPLDMNHFWIPEVIKPFRALVAELRDHLSIDGIFFDFEMYHAPEQTGMFTELMDFSDCAWKIYSAQNPAARKMDSVKKRIGYLTKHKKLNQYFTVLTTAARELGAEIKQQMNDTVPHLLFAGYAPHIPNSWWYRGFISGMSSKEKPFILGTFNTDWNSHWQWLIRHNMHLLHGTAVMLGKLQQSSDCAIIPQQLKFHDFIWFNRPSRMIYQNNEEQLEKVWWGIEASPSATNELMQSIKKSCCNALKKQ